MTAPAWPLLSAFFQSAMSCPICGKHCRCAEPRVYSSSDVTLVDVDSYDPSEEQFASGVMTGVASQAEDEQLSSGTIASARARYGIIPVEVATDLPLPTNIIGSANLENSVSQENEWRNEVASRLQSYKARRRRGQGDDNLAFNFESTAGNHVFLKPEPDPFAVPDPEPAPNYYAAHAYATEPVFPEVPEEPVADAMDHTLPELQGSFTEFSEPEPKPVPAPETAKLIFFPKPPMQQEMHSDELADPVFDTPRILDAPEEVESEAVAIPLADITLHPEQEEDPCVPYVEPALDLPVRVAPVSQRVCAELFDALLVLLASGAFGGIVAKMSADIFAQEKHAFVGMVVLVPAIFWSIYKYIFLVHGGTTMGMQITRLRLVYFDGQSPTAGRRRYRALSMLVSIFPLGLGLLWSFVDPDRLCWHDRISRTYMTAR